MGKLRKVVAASCAELSFGQALSVAGVLDNLRGETGAVWRFAMSRQGSTSLGASPEMLVAFALGLTLFVLTLALNVLALYIVRKYREQYE